MVVVIVVYNLAGASPSIGMAWGMAWVYINYTVLNNTWPGQAPTLARHDMGLHQTRSANQYMANGRGTPQHLQMH